MKKLLTSLSTFVLVAGSAGGIATWTTWQSHHQVGVATQKTSVANETAQQIADKLNGKTIDLDPRFWAGDNLFFHQKYLISLLVKQGLITAAESKYVFWVGSKVINWDEVSRGTLTVLKDKQTVKADMFFDSSYQLNETAQQIADKIKNKTIQLDPFFWLDQKITDYPKRLREDFVEQGILTYKEAHYISWGPQHFVVNKPVLRPGNIVNVTKNGQTVSAGNVTIDVRYVSETAQQIADKIESKTIQLETGKWMNRDIAVASAAYMLRTTIMQQGLLTEKELRYVSWNHLTIKKPILYLGVVFNVNKDGQSAEANNIKLDARPHDETAQQIAEKLDGKTIRLDPAFWVGKSPSDYRQKFLNEMIQQGLINEVEKNSMAWPHITITDAKVYHDFYINVVRYDQSVRVEVALDVSPFETAQTIAKKLQAATILLNPGFWLRKDVFDYQSQLNDAIVQQGILTRREVQYVTWTILIYPKVPKNITLV